MLDAATENYLMNTDEQQLKDKQRKVWEAQVRANHRNKCANCGGVERLRVFMLVPEEAGGRLLDTNGTLLCRACEMAKEAAERATSPQYRRLVNFWVSQKLHARIEDALRIREGFVSLGHLVRYMMSKFVTDPVRFDDIERYQDFGSSDVKVNVWVDADTYETFKQMLEQRRMTVTEAVKSLIQMYDEETAILESKKVIAPLS
jgi:hypothetical protein